MSTFCLLEGSSIFAVSPLFQDDNSKRNSINELKIENVGSEISLVVENNLKLTGVAQVI